tara:strand:- start:1135 stop:3615 length:2481 start_codon:yes stop_codon:yes gene_type:complete
MALVNCSMDKKAVTVASGTSNVASVELEIVPDTGYVVAARDFVAGTNPDTNIIQSITLSDIATSGGPQNDGAYTAANKVKVLVDFVDNYTFSQSEVLDINPTGSATIDYLTPVKLQGTFVVPSSPVKCTFVASNVTDYASSGATNDFYVYDNPGDVATVMNMTIAATSGDFLSTRPTAVVSNSSSVILSDDYEISSVETYDSYNRLTQVVYTIKTSLYSTSRSGDLITFAGGGADIPGLDRRIYTYDMDTGDAGLLGINRSLEVHGDAGAQFRIKMQRGTLSGAAYTVDTTDGVYVFDNSRSTIADIFEPSSSTTTYPSAIQSNGSYQPATNPFTLDATGLFFRNILIPADTDGKVYRFTIIPETGTTIDPSALDIDTTTDPDVITFDITRKGPSYFTSNYDAPTRAGLTSTINYYNYLADDKGTTEPSGRKDSNASTGTDVHSYKLVITDDNEDFHLPNGGYSYTLKEFNYTESLNGGTILRPTVTADLRATDDGFFASKITSAGHSSHNNANNHDVYVDIVLTLAQRQALTDKTSFNTESFSSFFTYDDTDRFFKIKFFTTDAVPLYKSQTVEVQSDLSVSSGDDAHKNTTTLTAPALNRRKLYITGDDLSILSWGASNMAFTHNLDSFAFKTDQSSTTTLDLNFNVGHVVSKFINSVGRTAKYPGVDNSVSILISNDGGGVYSKQNITTASTTHAKLVISNAYIDARDLLPINFDTSDYELLFISDSGSSTQLATVNLTVPSQPAVSLASAYLGTRKLTIGSGSPNTFELIIDFNNTLSPLTSNTVYSLNCVINHRLNNAYQDVESAEELSSGGIGSSLPSPY